MSDTGSNSDLLVAITSKDEADAIVGHADISMTEHYLHVQESIRLDAVDRFSKAFPTGHDDPDDPDRRVYKVLP